MTSLLTIIRYPKYLGIFGFLSMALFRLPLWFSKNTAFNKLMGCGKNGTFDIHPDWRQWAIIAAVDKTGDKDAFTITGNLRQCLKQVYGSFIMRYTQFFGCTILCYFLEPIEGHGTWDGAKVFGDLPKQTAHEGPIAVLTRATIRLSRLSSFWKHVAPVAAQMAGSEGFISSVGIGEIPWIKQATFSIWESKEHMKQFAYKLPQHTEVVRKTHQEKWYSEDMFVRFRIIKIMGTEPNLHPLQEW